MRLFVEVLQSFCEDPRDLAEVRLSEAKLKGQSSSAQKQLQGQEVQVVYPTSNLLVQGGAKLSKKQSKVVLTLCCWRVDTGCDFELAPTGILTVLKINV